MKQNIIHIFFATFYILSCNRDNNQISVYIRNPDISVRKIENAIYVSGDCNFLIQLKGKKYKNWTTVFSSADEKPASDGEKFKVSGNFFLLYGDRFYVVQSAEMILRDEPIKAYLLIDSESGEVWCNSSQLNLPRFTINDLNTRGF